MDNDWLYSKERLEFRELCLNLLLHNLGSQLNDAGEPKYSSKSIYACAHDWVSQGNPATTGILNYYKNYYT